MAVQPHEASGDAATPPHVGVLAARVPRGDGAANTEEEVGDVGRWWLVRGFLLLEHVFEGCMVVVMVMGLVVG